MESFQAAPLGPIRHARGERRREKVRTAPRQSVGVPIVPERRIGGGERVEDASEIPGSVLDSRSPQVPLKLLTLRAQRTLRVGPSDPDVLERGAPFHERDDTKELAHPQRARAVAIR